MFADLLTSFRTRCSPHLRSMGYVDETLAMQKRARSRREAWALHLEHSRRFMLETAEQCKVRNKAVILGSGLLLDVPLRELSGMFKSVVLADVICLPGIRHEIAEYPNAAFVEYDVTETAEKLFRNVQQNLPGLPPAAAPSPPAFQEADLVVSLNILSQLWVIPRAYILKQRMRPGQEELDDWCRRLVESHYVFLRALRCRVCLIADHAFVTRGKDGSVISSGSTVYDLKLPEPGQSWTWDIAPLGTESSFFSKELVVGGWRFPGP